MELCAIKALTFDVFGTVVDVSGSLPKRVAEFGAASGIAFDASSFAKTWIAAYAQAIQAIVIGAPFQTVEIITRTVLNDVVESYGLGALTELQRNNLNLVWRRLDPWPDTISGLTRLRASGLQVVTLANGNVSLLRDLAEYGGLPWTQYLEAAESVGTYKPNPAVYQFAIAKLELDPCQIMMIASHRYDLDAASNAHMATGFIARPTESAGPGLRTPDVTVSDLDELASKFQAC